MTYSQPYSRRKAIGDAHEERMKARLEALGYRIHPYVRGEYKGWTRYKEERRSPTDWFADFMIVAPDGFRMFAEAKSCLDENKTSENYTVEVQSVVSQKKLINLEERPVLFVFDDWKVCDPDIIENNGEKRPGIELGRTDYYIFKRRMCVDFDNVFGTSSDAMLRRSSGKTNIFENYLQERGYRRIDRTHRFIHNDLPSVELKPNRWAATQASIIWDKKSLTTCDSLNEFKDKIRNNSLLGMFLK